MLRKSPAPSTSDGTPTPSEGAPVSEGPAAAAIPEMPGLMDIRGEYEAQDPPFLRRAPLKINEYVPQPIQLLNQQTDAEERLAALLAGAQTQ